MGAEVVVLDRSLEVLRRLDAYFAGRVKTLFATNAALEHHVAEADLVIGAVLVPGAAAPKVVTEAMVARMRPGSVIVDVSIDQGGCVASARPTTHAEPTYVAHGVVHYCVTNMPGAVPQTSTYALNAATLPYVLALANKGWQQALRDDIGLRAGLNVCAGQITHPVVAAALSRKYVPAITLLG
jgi:alanine dehydrogenase